MKTKKILILVSILTLLCLMAACTTKLCTVSFYADGELYKEYRIKKGEYLEDIPQVPEKEGYKGAWSRTDFEDEIESDIRVEAVYTRNSYTVVFRADGVEIARKVVEMGKTVTDIPQVPQKDGYTGQWNISQESFASLSTDTVVEAVYQKVAVAVTFYKNTYTYSLAKVKTGEDVEPNTYYVWNDEYVLTTDKKFVADKNYFVRARDYFTTLYAEDGVITSDIPAPPAQQGFSVKWMKINPTPTGDVLTEADFSSVTSDFSVVAYPYLTVSLVDTFAAKMGSVSCEIGEKISSLRPLATSLNDYEFYSWYLDPTFKTKLSLPYVFSENTTLYAKWISTRATDGVMISEGSVVGYSGSATDIYIPMKYQTDNGTEYVTSIAASAFKNSSVVSVSIPATVASIGDSAFYGCGQLVSVDFPDGNYVVSVGNSAFRSCKKLASVSVSERTNKVGSYAFYGCAALRSVDGFGECLTEEIERYAFAGCSELTSLILPGTVRTIGERAFAGDEKAAIGFDNASNVERVGSFAFENCKKFLGFSSEKLREIGDSVFAGCSSLTTATIFGSYKVPALFGKTAPQAGEENNFYSVTVTDTYYVPKSLFNVLVVAAADGVLRTDVLYDCYSVKNVSFSGELTEISSYAFRLENYPTSEERRDFLSVPFTVTLPPSLTKIGSYAFATRDDLAIIELPSLLESIGEYAFHNIASLASVDVAGGRSNLSYIGRDAFTETKWFDSYPGVVMLGKVVLGISEDYCRKATFYEITADKFKTCSVIAPYAFAGNDVLQKIVLSESIAQIGNMAFSDCTKLKTFAFGPYVSTSYRDVGSTILSGCNDLLDLTVCEDVDLPALFDGGVPSGLIVLRIAYSKRSSSIVAQNADGFSASDLKDTSVTALYIGDGFVEIGEDSFKEIPALTTVHIGKNVESIGDNAFFGCTALEKVESEEDSVLRSIGKRAFDGCMELDLFTFVSTLEDIGERSFASTTIASFKAPASLKTVGKSAFIDCTVLSAVELNEGLERIGDFAFKNCNLSSLSIPSTVAFYTEEDGYVGGEGMLDGNTGFRSVILSSGVVVRRLFGTDLPTLFTGATVRRGEIVDEQFADLTTLLSVNIANGVTAIGDRAFAGCDHIQRVVIPSSVSGIGESAFLGCSALSSVQIDTVDGRLAEVKKAAFKNCSSLRYVNFPASVQTGDWTEMFFGCAFLTTTNLPESVTEIGERAFSGCARLVNLRLHDNVTSIEEEAFYGCALLELDNVDFGSLEHIGARAFYDNKKINNVRAENATEIGENAYYGCASLKEMTICEKPASYYADAATLSHVSIVNVTVSVATIDGECDDYLAGCDDLTTVIVYTTESAFPAQQLVRSINEKGSAVTFLSASLYDDVDRSVVSNVYSKPSQLSFTYELNAANGTAKITGIEGSVTESYVYLPEATTIDGVSYLVTEIGDDAFMQKDITYVVIPSTVETIGDRAFAESSLETLVFESGSKCSDIKDRAFMSSNVVSVSFPSSVRSIGNAAFERCAELTNVYFSANSALASIGATAFSDTPKLTEAVFTGPIEFVGVSAFSGSGVRKVDFGDLAVLTRLSAYLFNATYNLSEVVLPDTVTVIEEGSFYNYGGSSFTFPTGLQTIGQKAFYRSKIADLSLPAGLIAIGNEAFYGNTELSSVALPDAVSFIGEKAFYGCEGVTELTIGKGVEKTGDSAFFGLLLLEKIVYNARNMEDLAEDNGVFFGAGTSYQPGVVVTFGEEVRSLPDHLFKPAFASGAPHLTSVVFTGTPTIERIGDRSFKDCSDLTDLVLPATVLSIGSEAFVGCSALTLYVESATEGAGWNADYKDPDLRVTVGTNNRTQGDFSYVLYDGGAYLTDCAVSDKVVVPSSLGGKAVIGAGVAFEGKSVKYVDLPDTVILPGSFRGCDELIGVSLKQGVTEIAEKAFYGCSSLLYFTLPDTLVKIGDEAFSGCDELSVLYVNSQDVLEALLPKERPVDPTDPYSQTVTDYPLLEKACGGLFLRADLVYVKGDLSYEAAMSQIFSVTLSSSRAYTKVLSQQNGYAVYSTLYWRSAGANTPYVYLMNDWTPDDEYTEIEKRYDLYVDGIGAMRDFGSAENVLWRAYAPAVKTVTVGRNVTSIGKYSFYEMTALSDVYFNAEECVDGSIGGNYFSTGHNDTSSRFTVRFGNYVTRVPSYLFYKNEYLDTIVWETNKVVSIGKSSFEDCKNIAVVTIPDCVKSIGESAFFGCSAVTSLTIGQGVKTFGNRAFGNFGVDADGFYLTTIRYNALSADNTVNDVFMSDYKLGTDDVGATVMIHKDVVSLPENLFYACDRLEAVVFPDQSIIRSLGGNVFYFCSNLRAVTLPSSLTTIGQSAFDSCLKLESIVFAENSKLNFVGEKAFYNTAYYNFDSPSVTNWTDGVLYLNGKKILLEARSSIGTEYFVADGTDVIAEKAFAGNNELKYVTIPSSVDVIDDQAFVGCDNLKTVFLTSATIISELNSADAHGGLCKNATVIYCRSDLMKNNRTRAGDYIGDNYRLTETDTVRNNNQYYSYTTLNWACGSADNTAEVYAYLLNDFDTVDNYRMVVTGDGAMTDYTDFAEAPWYDVGGINYGELVTKLSFSKNVTTVGSYAFARFTALSSVSYDNGDKLVSLGAYCFAGCASMETISIEKAVTTIGDHAFADCNRVTSVRFNALLCNDLASGNGVFRSLGRVAGGVSFEISPETVRIPDHLCNATNEERNSPNITAVRFVGGNGNLCRKIGKYAFAYCVDLQTMSCESAELTTISEYAFYDCKALTMLSLPVGVTEIREYAFKDCQNVRQFVYKAKDAAVETGAFENLGKTSDVGLSVEIADSVVNIPNMFLYNVDAVTSVTFPADDNCRCEVIGGLAFAGCTRITSVVLPVTLTAIGRGAFYKCTSLQSFTTPFVGGKSKAMVGTEATLFGYVFHADIEGDDTTGMTLTTQNCNSMDSYSYYIPDSIRTVTVTYYTNLYYGSFMNCTHIAIVNIPSSPVGRIMSENELTVMDNGKLIGDKAFYGCTSLTSYSVSDMLKEIGEEAFAGCRSLLEITIPKNVYLIGRRAFSDCGKVTKLYFNAQSCNDFVQGDNVFVGLGETKVTLYIGGAVTRIPEYFFDCEVTEPSDVPAVTEMELVGSSSELRFVGKYAFNNCTKLESVYLPSTLTSIGEHAFDKTAYYATQSKWINGILYYRQSGYSYVLDFDTTRNVSEVSVETDTRLIADDTFAFSSTITTVNLPSSLRYIGKRAFKHCDALNKVNFIEGEGGATSIETIGEDAFRECFSLTEFTIKKSVAYVGEGAFAGCDKITNVTIDSEEICSTITADASAGYLCFYAQYVNVLSSIGSDKTGSFIKSRFTLKQDSSYRVYERKN